MKELIFKVKIILLIFNTPKFQPFLKIAQSV